jgi:hypothetical protein
MQRGDLGAGSLSILSKWRSHFCQLLNLCGVNVLRLTQVYMAGPLILIEPLRLRYLLKRLKIINGQLLTKFQHSQSNLEVEQYVLISINLLFLFGIR